MSGEPLTGESVGCRAVASDPRPVCLITGTVSPYRREPFRLLSRADHVEVLAWEDTGPPLEGLAVRRVTQAGAVRRVLEGHYRAVICSLGGRAVLPGSYAAARLRGIPFVLWATIWEHPRTLAHRVSWRPTRHLYAHADAVATYGTHVSAYVGRYRSDSDSVFVAPQAVAVDHFAAPQPPDRVRAARARAGVEGDEQLLALFVGRLEEEKGVETLLEAWRRANLPAGARLALAGSGPLEARIARSGGSVRSLGHVDRADLPSLYAAADVLVLPSVATATFREPWGLVVNEAMLQRTPAITSDAVGSAAGGLVVQGRTGLIFPAGDAGALAGALERLADPGGERARMGEEARKAALRLDPQAWAEGMHRALVHARDRR